MVNIFFFDMQIYATSPMLSQKDKNNKKDGCVETTNFISHTALTKITHEREIHNLPLLTWLKADQCKPYPQSTPKPLFDCCWFWNGIPQCFSCMNTTTPSRKLRNGDWIDFHLFFSSRVPTPETNISLDIFFPRIAISMLFPHIFQY